MLKNFLIVLTIALCGCSMKNPAYNQPYDSCAHCGNDIECCIDTVNAMDIHCDKFTEYKTPDIREMRDNGTLEIYKMWPLPWIPLGVFGAAAADDEDGDGYFDWAKVWYVDVPGNYVLYHELVHIKGPCKDRWNPFDGKDEM